jgi:hypothetical protein
MKRSEMIKFLDEQMDAYLGLDLGYQEKVGGGALLLERLEKLGMLPPPTEDKWNTQFIDKTTNGRLYADLKLSGFKTFWEPEDG